MGGVHMKGGGLIINEMDMERTFHINKVAIIVETLQDNKKSWIRVSS